MEKRGSGTWAFFRLIGYMGMLALIIWLAVQFIDKISWTTLFPAIGLYAGYKIFSITLDIIKLLAKIAVIIAIICLLFI